MTKSIHYTNKIVSKIAYALKSKRGTGVLVETPHNFQLESIRRDFVPSNQRHGITLGKMYMSFVFFENKRKEGAV